MFPCIYTDDGVVRDQRILIGGVHNFKFAVLRVETEPAPTRPLNGGNGSIKSRLQVVERAKVTLDSLLERAVLQLSATLGRWGQIFPEERVVDVSTAVELDSGLQLDLLANVVVLDGGVVSLDGVVEVGDVQLVVLAVVDRHDLLADGWLQSIVCIRQLGKGVLRHDCVCESGGGQRQG